MPPRESLRDSSAREASQLEWSYSRARRTPSKNRVSLALGVPLRSRAYLTFGIPLVASCVVILPATSTRRPIQRFSPSLKSFGGFVLPLQLLGLQILGQGLLPSSSLSEHLLEILQLQLQVFDGVVGLGEFPGPADNRALRLRQGAVEHILLLGQL